MSVPRFGLGSPATGSWAKRIARKLVDSRLAASTRPCSYNLLTNAVELPRHASSMVASTENLEMRLPDAPSRDR